jgi:tRNA uridine 5-carboxymethylaminomethyl modification enzyme
VKSLLIKENAVYGVVTGLGHKILGRSVVVTSGTFLNGVIHIGEKNFGGGRISEKNATGITEQLVDFGFESNRLKTGNSATRRRQEPGL